MDFGIGRGLTKIVSEKIGLNQSEKIPGLFWTSLFLMFIFSFLFALGFVFLIPSLINDIIKITESLKSEAIHSFYALAIAIPIVATTAALRGVLESYQKFLAINLVRIFLGVFTFLGPVIVLMITNSLFWIIIFMIIIRIIVWVIYLFQCFRLNEGFKTEVGLDFTSIKPVIKFSIWISIANIVGPLIAYSDRFLIGGMISAAAITYYSTPYEVVTKLLLIPGALVGVLFPVFSSSFLSMPELTKKLFLRGVKFIFLIIYPAVFLIVTFSFEGMQLWLGGKFALNSSLVLQFLAIGILMNCLSLIPNIFFQGTGRPHIPTLINLIELPFYLFFMWWAIKMKGIDGAAFVYMILATVDAAMMYFVVNKIFKVKFESSFGTITFMVMIIALIIPFLIQNIIFKFLISLFVLSIFIVFVWKYLISSEEKMFFITSIKSKIR